MYREVRERWPEMSVIFMSGSATAYNFDGETLLSKPFALDELIAVVDDSLGRHPSDQGRCDNFPPASLYPVAQAAMHTAGG